MLSVASLTLYYGIYTYRKIALFFIGNQVTNMSNCELIMLRNIIWDVTSHAIYLLNCVAVGQSSGKQSCHLFSLMDSKGLKCCLHVTSIVYDSRRSAFSQL